ncbi:MAG: Rne/Rng family ribonuclease [Clostridium sp.]|nr:Rne/Rng family ribonuclease [Clostridium sp.]
MAKSIVIAERDNIAAVFEDNKITEFFIHKGDILLGDVYLSKVENILPSIEAAFVDVGSDKMGFLHAADVIGKGGLQDKLSPKQKLVVQVVKEPTGHKGPRVTTSLSLPGRFCVLMPQETGISVSKKIMSAKERARLKSIVSLLKPVGLGVIIRTEAEGQTEAEIQEDLEILLDKWNMIVTQAELVEAPNLLYRDQDLLYRVIREACTEDVKEIVVDTPYAMHRVQQLIQNWNLNKNIDISVYKGSEPLLVASGVKKEIEQALNIKVNLPSGGYLFIQTTEALTVIDVNSGKFISSATQDETILKTNKEAVKEIARQLKLRNIGGMIIIDFIDMLSRADKIAIMEELELAVETDKAKPQVGQLSDLGLVEMTRHRQGQSLAEIFTKKCPHCGGTGQLLEDFGFSSAVAEGEFRSKAAKLNKSPMNNGKNRHNDNKHNNKVFNHQNINGNQPQKNEYDRRQQQNQISDQSVEETKDISQNQENPNNDNKSKRQNNKRRFNKNRKDQRFQEPVPQTEPEQIIENLMIEADKADEAQEKSQIPEQTEVSVVEEKPKKTTRKRTTKKVKETEIQEPIKEEVVAAVEVQDKKLEEKQEEKVEEKPVKKTKTRKASRARKKTAEKQPDVTE